MRDPYEVLGVDPDSGAALLLRASVHQVKGNTAQFATDICRAASLGVEEAKKPCAAVRSSP